MRMLAQLALLVLALGCNPGPTASASEQHAKANAAGLTSYDRSYGVYLNGAKVGWMRSFFTATDKSVAVGTELHAEVGGMGRVSTIDVREERSYNPADKLLQHIDFTQEAATGSVRIHGERRGHELELSITAGNVTTKDRAPIKETLDDALAQERLAKSGKRGTSVVATHFDPSLQKSVTVRYTLAELETRMLAGVATRAARIEAIYEGLGIEETSWLDEGGKVLESKVGGFFVARLEAPDVARRLDYQQDLLVSAVVKLPRPLTNIERDDKLALTFTGFGELLPPSSERQRANRLGDTVQLALSRDPPLPMISLTQDVPSGVRSDLAATPFIQSDAPAMREAARRAVGDAALFPDAVARLTQFVYQHVRDEYVPAYSNALEALSTGRGDCTEHSILFVAMARALGIPARVAVGIAYWPPGGGFGWHAWAEVWARGRWYSVDPTWNQPIADATHVKLADGGPAEQARIVMLLGRLAITDVGS